MMLDVRHTVWFESINSGGFKLRCLGQFAASHMSDTLILHITNPAFPDSFSQVDGPQQVAFFRSLSRRGYEPDQRTIIVNSSLERQLLKFREQTEDEGCEEYTKVYISGHGLPGRRDISFLSLDYICRFLQECGIFSRDTIFTLIVCYGAEWVEHVGEIIKAGQQRPNNLPTAVHFLDALKSNAVVRSPAVIAYRGILSIATQTSTIHHPDIQGIPRSGYSETWSFGTRLIEGHRVSMATGNIGGAPAYARVGQHAVTLARGLTIRPRYLPNSKFIFFYEDNNDLRVMARSTDIIGGLTERNRLFSWVRSWSDIE